MLDWPTAFLLATIVIVVLVVVLRWLSVYAVQVEAMTARARAEADISAARADRMRELGARGNASQQKAKGKAKKDEAEGEDPLEHVLDHPVVRGFASRYGIDVDGILDGDEKEIAKVDALLSRVKAPATATGERDWNAGNLPPPL